MIDATVPRKSPDGDFTRIPESTLPVDAAAMRANCGGDGVCAQTAPVKLKAAKQLKLRNVFITLHFHVTVLTPIRWCCKSHARESTPRRRHCFADIEYGRLERL